MIAQELAWTDVLTALVAGAAFILSILSLVVQVVQWRNSGARIKVKLSQGLLVSGQPGATDIFTVEASNIGRGTAQVKSWWLEPADSEDHWSLIYLMLPGSAELPTRIEGDHAASWLVEAGPVLRSAVEKGVTRVRPGLSLGSGKQIRGDWVDLTKALRALGR